MCLTEKSTAINQMAGVIEINGQSRYLKLQKKSKRLLKITHRLATFTDRFCKSQVLLSIFDNSLIKNTCCRTVWCIMSMFQLDLNQCNPYTMNQNHQASLPTAFPHLAIRVSSFVLNLVFLPVIHHECSRTPSPCSQ